MWVKLTDTFAEHPKVYALTDRQFRLHITAMLWAARNGTDGALPSNYEPAIKRSRDAAALVQAGLWEITRNGWQIHDWLEYNPTAQQAKLERERRAQATRQWRQRSRQRPELQ